MAKLIVELPDELHRALKGKAAEQQRTLKEIVTAMVREYVHEAYDGGGLAREGTGLCGSWSDARSTEEIVADIRAHRRWSSRGSRRG